MVVSSALGLANDSQPKSESVTVLAALEIRKDFETDRAGLWVELPGLLATSLQIPAPRIFTVLPVTEQMPGVEEVTVVTPEVWLTDRALSGSPKVALAIGPK